MLFSFDKVTTGTYNFVSVIRNSNPVGGLFATVISARAQFLDQVRINSTSQLINRMSINVLVKLQLPFLLCQLCLHHNQDLEFDCLHHQ